MCKTDTHNEVPKGLTTSPQTSNLFQYKNMSFLVSEILSIIIDTKHSQPKNTGFL